MKCLKSVSIVVNVSTVSATMNDNSQKDRKITVQLTEYIKIILTLDKTKKYQYLLE